MIIKSQIITKLKPMKRPRSPPQSATNDSEWGDSANQIIRSIERTQSMEALRELEYTTLGDDREVGSDEPYNRAGTMTPVNQSAVARLHAGLPANPVISAPTGVLAIPPIAA